MAEEPKLARRRENRKSTIISGRTIGEARERLETKNERVAARKKDKKKKTFRISFTVIGFAILAAILVGLCFFFLNSREEEPIEVVAETTPANLTIEVIDEDAGATSGKITSRMETYLSEVEQDFRELNYTAKKAVIPSGSVRTVYLYLEGRNGFIKMTIDRGSAVSVEDADRLIRYLAAQGINDFEYIDVRIPGKAFWK